VARTVHSRPPRSRRQGPGGLWKLDLTVLLADGAVGPVLEPPSVAITDAISDAVVGAVVVTRLWPESWGWPVSLCVLCGTSRDTGVTGEFDVIWWNSKFRCRRSWQQRPVPIGGAKTPRMPAGAVSGRQAPRADDRNSAARGWRSIVSSFESAITRNSSSGNHALSALKPALSPGWARMRRPNRRPMNHPYRSSSEMAATVYSGRRPDSRRGATSRVGSLDAVRPPGAAHAQSQMVRLSARGGVRYPLRYGHRDPAGWAYLHIRDDEPAPRRPGIAIRRWESELIWILVGTAGARSGPGRRRPGQRDTPLLWGRGRQRPGASTRGHHGRAGDRCAGVAGTPPDRVTAAPARRPRGQAYATPYEQMYAQPVENEHGAPLAGAAADQPIRRTLRWARIRELGEAIVADGDPVGIVEQARELVDVLRGLQEWDRGPGCGRSRWCRSTTTRWP
jgi:hypothetical protein